MATCLSSISTTVPIELYSNSEYASLLNNKDNALYQLTNDMAQSVSFTSVVTPISGTTISVTMTIYEKKTLRVLGSSNIDKSNFSVSFTLPIGSYLICLRDVISSSNLSFKSQFTSYNNVATLNATSSLGSSMSGELTTYRRVPSSGDCKVPIAFEILEGALPTGLKMNIDGYVQGTMPMLDCDVYNKDLPSSNFWYQQLNGESSVSTYGRIYRFRVKVYLPSDLTKYDIKWFYINIIPDFSKNIMKVENIGILPSDKIAVYDDVIDLTNATLCDICPTDSLTNDTKTKVSYNIDGTVHSKNIYTSESENVINKSISNLNIVSTTPKNNNKQTEEEFFNEILSNSSLDDNFDNIYQVNTENSYISDIDVEMIYLDDLGFRFDTNGIPLLSSKYTGESTLLSLYYNENFNESDNLFIVRLKDSTLFQQFLYENNGIKENIIENTRTFRNYENITMEYEIVEKKHYLTFKGKNLDIINTQALEAVNEYNDIYTKNYLKLPILVVSPYGWNIQSSLYVKGK